MNVFRTRGESMTLLLILMDHQTYLVHKTELPAERLANAIADGDWSAAAWQGQWINELPRQVTALDGLVIVSVSRPAQSLPAEIPSLARVTFTAREQQTLDLLMEGLTPKEISTHIRVTRRTIDKYLAAIKEKLESRTLIQTVGRAVALGYWKPRRTE